MLIFIHDSTTGELVEVAFSTTAADRMVKHLHRETGRPHHISFTEPE